MDDREVAIDWCHIEVIKGICLGIKPESVLELGFGSGRTTMAILGALAFNKTGKLTVVDNWVDFGGKPPMNASFVFHPSIELVCSSEEDFITSNHDSRKFDLIISDADHFNSHKWWRQTLQMLNPGGVAFFHDILNPNFPNLSQILEAQSDFQTQIFHKSSRTDERCWRGLLMAWKPKES